MNENKSQDTVKNKKSTAIMNAFIIGFLIGIVIYSVTTNSVGFITLLPLYLIYKFVNQPKKSESETTE